MTDLKSKRIVLKKTIDKNAALKIINEKKTSLFKSRLKKPKAEEVHLDSLDVYYEGFLKISGKYSANYLKPTIHTISVASNVNEVIFGDEVFKILSKSVLQKAFVAIRDKNKIDLPMEEHVFVEEEGELFFDNLGKETKLQYKIDQKNIENYPDRILDQDISKVKKPEIKYSDATSSLTKFLKKPLEKDVRNLEEEFILNEIVEIFVPIFEARLIGPNKKTGLLRIDAVKNKIL